MNLTKIEKLLKAINSASEIRLNDISFNLKIETSAVKDVEDNVVLTIKWADDYGQMFEAEFTEKALDDSKVIDHIILATDTTNEDCEILLFTLTPKIIDI